MTLIFRSQIIIATIFAAFSAVCTPTYSQTPYQVVVQSQNPRLYWRLDQPAGMTALNTGSLGSAGNGTIGGQLAIGAAPLNFGACQYSARSFKSTESRVLLENFDMPTDDVSVTFLVQGSDNGESHFFGYAATANGNDFTIGSDDNEFRTIVQHNIQDHPGIDVMDGEVHHIAITRQRSTGTVLVYVDGQEVVQVASQAGVGLVPGGNLALCQDFDSVNPPFGFNPNQALDGSIDEFAIFGHLLSPAEIQSQYQQLVNHVYAQRLRSLNPVLYWRLNETGTSVCRNYGTACSLADGTFGAHAIQNESVLASETMDHSVAFDGTTDSHVVAEGFDWPTGDVSVAFFVQGIYDGTDNHLFSFVTTSGDRFRFVETNGHLQAQVGPQTFNFVRFRVLDGTPHHVGISRDASNGEFRIYIDGSLVITQTFSVGFTFQSNGTLALGQNVSSTVAPYGFLPTTSFQGAIDEFSVFNRILTASEFDSLAGATAVTCEKFYEDGTFNNSINQIDASLRSDDSSTFKYAADDIVIAEDTRFVGIEWKGIYASGVPSSDDFQIKVYDDNSEAPGSLLHIFNAGNFVNRTPTGETLNGRQVFQYRTAIDFVVPADTRIWFGIGNDTNNNYENVVDTNSGNSRHFRTGSGWIDTFARMGFRLYSDACPYISSGEFAPNGCGYSETETAQIQDGLAAFYDVQYDGQATLTIEAAAVQLMPEIGLYDQDGNLVGSSQLSGDPNVATLVFSDLPAGEYVLAAGLFDSTFGAEFDVSSSSMESGLVDVSVSTNSSGYSEIVACLEPVLYWQLDEAVGGTAINFGSLGTAADGTYGSEVNFLQRSLLASEENQSVGFEKNVESRVLLETFDMPTDDFSISFIVQGQTDGLSVFLGYAGDSTFTNEILLGDNGGQFLMWLHNSAFTFEDVDVLDGTPHHVAITRSHGSGLTQIYVDGELAGSQTLMPGQTLIPMGRLALGQDFDSFSPSYSFDPNQALNGAIDEVAIFATELSAEQVSDLAAAGPMSCFSYFDNGMFENGGTSIDTLQVSDNGIEVADDVRFAASTRVVSVGWTGAYFFSGPPTSETFTISIYADENGQPMDSTVLAQVVVDVEDANRTDTGVNFAGVDIYQYSADLDFVFEGGTRYWIAVNSTNDLTGANFRLAGQAGNGNAHRFINGGWQDIDTKAAVRLRSANCPRFEFTPSGFGYDETQFADLDVQQVAYYDVTYDGQAELTIDTFFSEIDTAIGLYSATGMLVGSNDDANENGESQLVFENLTAGDYILAVGLAGTTFDEGFDVDSLSMLTGEATVRVSTEQQPILIGDVNRDGFVNLLDIEPFVALVSSGEFQIEADINEDGFVNLLDIEPFINLISG